MTEIQDAYPVKQARRIVSGISQETLSRMRAEVKKLIDSLDKLEDSLDATDRRVTYLETWLEDDRHEDSV